MTEDELVKLQDIRGKKPYNCGEDRRVEESDQNELNEQREGREEKEEGGRGGGGGMKKDKGRIGKIQ